MLASTHRIRIAAAGAAAALLLAACGAADDGAAETDTDATTDESTTEEATTDEPADDADPDQDGTDEDTGGSEADDDGGTSDDEATEDEEDDEEGSEEAEDDDAPADPLLAVTATAPDGSTFTIQDAVGRPVLVETFATWCSNCRQQLVDTQAAAEAAGGDVVVLALSVETDLDPASLADYAAENGFDDIRFGVLDEAGVVALADRFGGSVLNPPATPKFRVDEEGTVSALTTGYESTQEILDSLGA